MAIQKVNFMSKRSREIADDILSRLEKKHRAGEWLRISQVRTVLHKILDGHEAEIATLKKQLGLAIMEEE